MATLTAVKKPVSYPRRFGIQAQFPGVGDTAKPASYVITISADVTCALLDGTGQNGYFNAARQE